MTRHALAPVVASAVVLLAACRSDPPKPLAVEVAGCAAWRSDRCALTAERRTLRVWLPEAPAGELSLRAGKSALPVDAPEELETGRAARVTVPLGAGDLTVEIEGEDQRYQDVVTLADVPPCDPVDRATALRRERKTEEARAALGDAAPDDACRPRWLGLRARLALDADQPEEAARGLAEAAAAHRAAGEVSGHANDSFALAYVHTYVVPDFAAADRALEGLDGTAYPEGQARLAYYRGALALERADVRGALTDLAAAEARARELGMTRLHVDARDARVEALQTLGRHDEAEALLQAVLDSDLDALDPCDRARIQGNVGWVRLARREGASDAADPRDALQDALSSYRSGCPKPAAEANVLVNLALAELQARDPAAAARHLDAAAERDPEPDAYVADWAADLRGRVAAAGGDHGEALRLYDALLAEAPPVSEARWRAMLGRARALEGLRRRPEAAEAYLAAEALLDQQLLRIPLGEGRGTFVGDRAAGAEGLVDLLVGLERPADALTAARHARARVLRVMQRRSRLAGLGAEARGKWDAAIGRYRVSRETADRKHREARLAPADERGALLAARRAAQEEAQTALDDAYAALAGGTREAELRAPSPGEILLAYYPVGTEWVGFVATPEATRAARLGTVDATQPAGALSTALLAPFEAELRAARRVTVLDHGALRGVDFHRLPFEGGPLVARAAVAYALDLPGRPTTEAKTALVVSDPEGNLAGARNDGKVVAAALGEGWEVRSLRGGEASREAVVTAIGATSLLHYSGHAAFKGREGWSSGLALAGGELSIGDILSLPRVPARVVLAGCDTGRADDATSAQTLGLAQAFLAAGAQQVLAAPRPVRDDEAPRLSKALYRDGGAALGDLVTATAEAQRQLAEACPDCDWAAWRVLTR